VTVTAPPRPPRRLSDPVERDEFEALVEALIEEARKRAQRRRRRNGAVVTLVALVGVAVFAIFGRSAQSQTASPALAGGSSVSHASKQRVEITATGIANPSSSMRFVLTPVRTGAIKPDSGTETSVARNQRDVVREGQSVHIVTWITTAEGKLGSFVLRVRIDHVDAGNGFHIGTGTWTFVRGTGAYADATGGGRVANAWVGTNTRLGRISERRTGFLTIR
jgi:hypothetical protein